MRRPGIKKRISSSETYQDCWIMSLGQISRHMCPVLLFKRVKDFRLLKMGYGSIRKKDTTQVTMMTFLAWDVVCQDLDSNGLQMAL